MGAQEAQLAVQIAGLIGMVLGFAIAMAGVYVGWRLASR